MMPDVKKYKVKGKRSDPYGMDWQNIPTMVRENDDRVYCAIADGEAWKMLRNPHGPGFTTLVYAVLCAHRVDLLKLIIERHAEEKASIFSWPVHKDFLMIQSSAWRAFNRITYYHAGLSTKEQNNVEYHMFSLMFDCGGCPVEELVCWRWGKGPTTENKIHRRLVCELGKRRASWAIAWWSKQVGESWTDMVVPLNNIFDAATFEDYWG